MRVAMIFAAQPARFAGTFAALKWAFGRTTRLRTATMPCEGTTNLVKIGQGRGGNEKLQLGAAGRDAQVNAGRIAWRGRCGCLTVIEVMRAVQNKQARYPGFFRDQSWTGR
jgi:hypothetical protein